MKLSKILTLLVILTTCAGITGCGLKGPPKPADGAPSCYPGQYPKPE